MPTQLVLATNPCLHRTKLAQRYSRVPSLIPIAMQAQEAAAVLLGMLQHPAEYVLPSNSPTIHAGPTSGAALDPTVPANASLQEKIESLRHCIMKQMERTAKRHKKMIAEAPTPTPLEPSTTSKGWLTKCFSVEFESARQDHNEIIQNRKYQNLKI